MSKFPPRSDSYNAPPPKNAASAYAGAAEPRRPLIDFVTNEWASKPSYRASSFDSNDSYAHYPFEKEHYDPPHLPEWLKRVLRVQVPRRVQRYLGGYLLFILAVWFGWLYWLQPAWQHEQALDQSAQLANSARGQAFGVNMRPSFADMVHLGELDAEFLPGKANPEKRLVFVGDVHGCRDERKSAPSSQSSRLLLSRHQQKCYLHNHCNWNIGYIYIWISYITNLMTKSL